MYEISKGPEADRFALMFGHEVAQYFGLI